MKPNSWASTIATAWMPWNMMAMPTTPGTSTVAKADWPACPLPPPTPWPMVGNTYRNTKTSRNGWTSVRATNSNTCLRSTARSRRTSAASASRLAAAAERAGVAVMAGRWPSPAGASPAAVPAAAAPAGVPAGTVVAISRAAPCR